MQVDLESITKNSERCSEKRYMHKIERERYDSCMGKKKVTLMQKRYVVSLTLGIVIQGVRNIGYQ
jgi:hypothetical protein